MGLAGYVDCSQIATPSTGAFVELCKGKGRTRVGETLVTYEQ